MIRGGGGLSGPVSGQLLEGCAGSSGGAVAWRRGHGGRDESADGSDTAKRSAGLEPACHAGNVARNSNPVPRRREEAEAHFLPASRGQLGVD